MSWTDVWRKKGDTAPPRPGLSDLMTLNGYDTGAGYAEFSAMEEFSGRCAGRLGIEPGTEILEIGCGGGAWLFHQYNAGVRVSGVDISPGHLNVARTLMPAGRFACANATSLPFAADSFDVVFAGACFLYLPDENAADAAFGEIEKALRPGGRGAITDLPDLATRADAERIRRGALGKGEYDRMYAGLEHQYFERDRMIQNAQRLGLRANATTQEIAGYGNSPYRFNIWFEKP